MELFENFTGLYRLAKTLRFELIPIGKTKEWIEKKGILDTDERRSESYSAVKKIIDRYHKEYVNESLSNFTFKVKSDGNKDSLEDFMNYYYDNNNDDLQKKTIEIIKGSLRKSISKHLVSGEKFKTLFSQDLIKKVLPQFVENDDERGKVKEFENFTTYFVGFHENRRNIYSDEDKSSSISYRLVNENLPKFIDNLGVYEKVSSNEELVVNIKQLFSDFQEYLYVNSIDELFSLESYNLVLTQSQIEIYNSIIGGRTENNQSVKIKGLNEYINLYNQKHKDGKLPKFKLLYKQILSDRCAVSWLPEEFTSDNELRCSLNNCYLDLTDSILGDKNLKNLLCSMKSYNTNEIYIKNDLQLTEISQKIFGDWSKIQNSIVEHFKTLYPKKKIESEGEYIERLHGIYKKQSSFSISFIEECLGDSYIVEFYGRLGTYESETKQKENLFEQITNAYNLLKEFLSTSCPLEKNLLQDKDRVIQIKTWLDSIKNLQRFIKPLLGSGNEGSKDERFYGELSGIWDELDKITPLYNMTRNYLTRKPYSTDKIKLNFDNSTLMSGWDLNKEKDNKTIILRKDGYYYVAIVDKNSSILFKSGDIVSDGALDGDKYEKMVYKLLPGPNKMLPKVFLVSEKGKVSYNPSEEIIRKYELGTHTKGDNFDINDCRNLIDYFKSCINRHEDWCKFGFRFSPTASYNDIGEFYKEVESQGYNISFTTIPSSYVDKLVNEGQLYLFKLFSKDFSPYSKGMPNIHTLYWKALFEQDNLNNVIYKLNGQAEIFYRKKSINNSHPTHPANVSIKNKNVANVKTESIFTYDLVKDRRYTIDKFFFHVPITLNFRKIDGKDNINDLVRTAIKQCDDVHIIGIDRGERHLLYITVVDINGTIKEQMSLNTIINSYKNNVYSTDYHALLDSREGNRKMARENWQTIEKIKEIKEGYLSQVIHKISELMIKYNAIVVLEDLNDGFMRGRQKVEKQVYQKFERMLIDKLNYLVKKGYNYHSPGGLYNALQLTSKFESFQKMKKQCGFLFYVPAWNTSNIDPTTGFVNFFNLKYENVEKSRTLLSKFDMILYNQTRDWFEFSFNYSNFSSKAEGTRLDWKLCTYGNRIVTFRNPDNNSQWDSKEVVLTDEFKTLFNKYGIDCDTNLKEAIIKQNDKCFFESLLKLIRLTLQMRNSITGTEVDYLVSPIQGNNGTFFDSRSCSDLLPRNADANGAYNIARKGVMIVQQIKSSDNLESLKFDISNKKYIKFIQNCQ